MILELLLLFIFVAGGLCLFQADRERKNQGRHIRYFAKNLKELDCVAEITCVGVFTVISAILAKVIAVFLGVIS